MGSPHRKNMVKMNIVMDDELAERFRKTVFEQKGMKKGNISESIEEAVEKWIEFYESEKEE